jgi:branched-chain amino acid transport system ATP-binding protein
MLAIGRALMAEPTVLLLDEPSLGLAPLLVKQIFEIIRAINAQGTTVVLVSRTRTRRCASRTALTCWRPGRLAARGARGLSSRRDPRVRCGLPQRGRRG